MSKNYRTSGVPSLSQGSHHTWTNYERAKPEREPNRNGPVKTIKPRKKGTRMPDMQDILSQLNGAIATESEVESEVVAEPTKKAKPASGTVSIATGSITIARKKRGDKIVRLLEIELSPEQLTELGITD
jgi:hypothetical protein